MKLVSTDTNGNLVERSDDFLPKTNALIHFGSPGRNPDKNTMLFETQYEPELQENYFTKSHLIEYGAGVWTYVNGELAGEILGCAPIYLQEEIPDLDHYDRRSFYTYTTTVLPKFQGRGVARMMKVYLLGKLPHMGYERVIGHSTSTFMTKLNASLGAVFHTDKVHENWCGSKRTAYYYTMPLALPYGV